MSRHMDDLDGGHPAAGTRLSHPPGLFLQSGNTPFVDPGHALIIGLECRLSLILKSLYFLLQIQMIFTGDDFWGFLFNAPSLFNGL